MGKTNFQYDETGNTYYYVFLTFLGLVLFPATYYNLFSASSVEILDEEKKKKLKNVYSKDSVYWEACSEKAERLTKRDPWSVYKSVFRWLFVTIGWVLFATVVYKISQFDYEMANFDPYEILQVTYSSTPKEIKKKYKLLSLKYHPDKPTGNEKLFMKLTKAYNALTDETARYNWEHYGNPDGPQAMEFGIGLPAWIVEEKNSIWVLGVYTLIFMIGLPTAVYYWWSNSIKFSGEQVYLSTIQLYYYFFHKTPHMMLKRILMVLAASLEFDKGHNQAVVERDSDNTEIPSLMKQIPNLGCNNKEKPLCFSYSVKSRALLFAHLSRLPLPRKTLHIDRLFVIDKCPYLINEMVNCICQLILLAHANRIAKLPSLDTIESTMKLSPLIVQALWDKKSPLLQLPHIEEDMLKHFHSRKRNIKSLQQLAQMKDEERRNVMRTLTDEQYKDVITVLAAMPTLDLEVTTEVIDDEEQHVVTSGSIITVTIVLHRKTMESLMIGTHILRDSQDYDPEDKDSDFSDDETKEGVIDDDTVEPEKKKTPVWKKPQKKKPAKKSGAQKAKSKPKHSKPATSSAPSGETATTTISQSVESTVPNQDKNSNDNSFSKKSKQKFGDASDGSDGDSGSESDSNEESVKAQSNPDNEDDEEAEWEKIQRKMNKRDKALEGKSKVSHSVHCPYFTSDKQEFWWCYISDRKSRALISPPYHVTSLIDREEVELKFTAPQKPGHHTFTVCVRSDSYLGLDHQEDIKLDVHEARESPTEHPQWEFEDDEEDAGVDEEDSSDDYATDDDYDDES